MKNPWIRLLIAMIIVIPASTFVSYHLEKKTVTGIKLSKEHIDSLQAAEISLLKEEVFFLHRQLDACNKYQDSLSLHCK